MSNCKRPDTRCLRGRVRSSLACLERCPCGSCALLMRFQMRSSGRSLYSAESVGLSGAFPGGTGARGLCEGRKCQPCQVHCSHRYCCRRHMSGTSRPGARCSLCGTAKFEMRACMCSCWRTVFLLEDKRRAVAPLAPLCLPHDPMPAPSMRLDSLPMGQALLHASRERSECLTLFAP